MKLMPSCKDITEHSSDYLDRNLSFMQRLGFKMHLFMCTNCERYVSQLKLTIATIGKIKDAEPQPADEQQVQTIVNHIKQQTDKKE